MNRYSLLLNDLKSQLKYDPLSGSFIRKVRSSKSVKIGDKAGYVDGYGYITLSLNGIKYQSHRLAWFYMTGNWPERIDHIDHDRQNNR